MNSANSNPTPVMSNGIWDLISQSGPVAKLILLILIFCSVTSWAIILMKYWALRTGNRENSKFLTIFWNSKNMDEVLSKTEDLQNAAVAKVFRNGLKELKKLTERPSSGTPTIELVENVNRALMRASNTEAASLERHVGWLATIASATPFIGLFGTVWGIMNSFQGIGASGSANLAVVAPGISEALITTAAGIGAAVPAVIAYNHFAGVIKRQLIDMDCFTHDFLNIVQRSLIGSNSTKGSSG